MDNPVSEDLLAGADVVIVTGEPSRRHRGWALTRHGCSRPGRTALVVTISDFGWTGPWSQRPATEFTLQAASGLTGFRGDPAGPPISIGGDAGRVHGRGLGGLRAMALRRRVAAAARAGTSTCRMLEAITLHAELRMVAFAVAARPPIKRSVEVPSIEPAKDGYVGISMVTGQQWLDFAAMVDCPEFTEIAQLQIPDRAMGLPRLDPRTDRSVDARARTVDEIVELGQLFRLPLAPLGNGSTIPEMDHLQARGVYIDNPAGFMQPRAPWLMSSAGQAPVAPLPR